MFKRRRIQALAGGALIAALSASVATAAIVQTYSQKFTAKRPNQSTGMTITAAQPGANPVEAEKVTLTFPSGTKINLGAVAKCAKPPSCPANSKIGIGSAIVKVSGVSVPLTGVNVYNASGGMVIVVDTGVKGVPPVPFKIVRSGLKLTLDLPPLAIPTPGGGAVKAVLSSLSLKLAKMGTAKKPYVTTPPTCPKGNAWTFKSKFEYVDKSSMSLTSKSACVKH